MEGIAIGQKPAGGKTKLEPKEEDSQTTITGTAKPKPSQPKPRSLPPPGEAFQPPEPKKKKGKVPSKGAVADMGRITKTAGGGISKKNGDVASGNAGSKKGKQSKAKPQGMMSVINSHSATMNQYFRSAKTQPARSSVLVRPTERTKRTKEREAAEEPKDKPAEASKHPAETPTSGGKCWFMELDKATRALVWRYVVVHPRFFIWPDQVTGREQPDLAMTCREIREEVLPIFYGENKFAVEVSPPFSNLSSEQGPGQAPAKFFGGRSIGVVKGRTEPRLNIPVIKQWAAALEQSRSFSMIRRWVFSYTNAKATNALEASAGEVDGSLVVAVTVAKRQDGGWFLPDGVQIHREAVCVLPGHEDYGNCIVKEPPKWLNTAVSSVLSAAKRSHFTGEMICDLAVSINHGAAELAGSRCEEAISSIEAIFEGEIV